LASALLTIILTAVLAYYYAYIPSIGVVAARKATYYLRGPHKQVGYLVVNNDHGNALYTNVWLVKQEVKVYREVEWGIPSIECSPANANASIFKFDMENQVLFINFTCIYGVIISITLIWG